MSFTTALAPVAELFTPLAITWGFCGGWAIDLFLDRPTRPHKDVDVAILRSDQLHVFAGLRRRGWRLEKAVDGRLIPLAEDEEIAFNAGSHTELVRMKYADFKRLVEPTIASFARG